MDNSSRATNLCAILESVCSLRSDEDAQIYARVVTELAEIQDPSTLPKMMLCFRGVDAGEIQYELLEACERFPKELFVDSVIKIGASCLAKSPDWLGMLLQSLLNTDEYRDLFAARFNELDLQSKAIFREFFLRLAKRNVKYESLLSLN